MVIRCPVLDVVLDPFTRRDLTGLGLSRHELDALLSTGQVVQPVRGLYLDARRADDGDHRARGLGLLLRDGWAAGRTTAAWVHGIDVRTPGRHTAPLPLVVVVPRGTTPPRRAGVVAFAEPLADHDVVVVRGTPVTTPERTALDLARWAPPFLGLGALDAFAHAGLVEVDRLELRLREWKGDRGVARARQLVGWCDPRTESQGESWFRLRLLEAGFPRPRVQVSLGYELVDGSWLEVFRLDLGWDDLRLAGEYDGEDHHTEQADRDADDARRERVEREFGWRVVPVRKGAVLGRSLDLERGFGELLGLEPRTRERRW